MSCRRWPQHRQRAECHRGVERTDRVSFGEWRRQVREIVEMNVPGELLHFLLDDHGLRRDHARGMSVSRAARERMEDVKDLSCA